MNNRYTVIVRQATIFDLDLVAPLFDAYRQFYRMPADLALAKRAANKKIRQKNVRQKNKSGGRSYIFVLHFFVYS